MTFRAALLIASLLLAAAVAAGAFGAHALKGRLAPEMMAVYQTAVQYHFGHALGLFAIGLLASRAQSGALVLAAWLIVAGIALFCGSLYALALTGIRGFGAITPFGGAAFIAGWLCVAWWAWNATV